MGITFKGFEIMLQEEAAVILSIEKYETVTEADIINDNKVFLDNRMKHEQLEEPMIQKAIQRLIEKEALLKWERDGNKHIYSKSPFFYDEAKDILDVLFGVIDYEEEYVKTDDLEPEWVISCCEEEIYFDFDMLERLIGMYVKMKK